MKKMNCRSIRFILLVTLMIIGVNNIKGQGTMPGILPEGTIKEQMDYILQKTKIYDGYRTIDENMYQKMMANFSDSLKKTNSEIALLKNNEAAKNSLIDSLNSTIETTGRKLDEITKSRSTSKFLGLEINNAVFNTVVGILFAVMAILLVIGFLAFKRNLAVTRNTKNEYEDLRKEFEAYRKASREAREKMSMDHFNEIKKLKANLKS